MRFSVACSISAAIAALATALQAGETREPDALDLTELMSRMATTAGVIADFREQKQIALLEKPLNSSGRLYFAPPDRLARFTFEPEFSALVIDGDRLHFQEQSGEAFDLSSSPMARTFVDNLIVLFNGDIERLRALYHTEFSAEGEDWTLVLKPRRAPLSEFVAEIALRGGMRGMREMVVRNTDGDRTDTQLDVLDRDHSFSEEALHALFVERTPPAPEPSR